MADTSKLTDGPTPDDPSAFDYTSLPDWNDDFINADDILAFEKALSAPETSPSEEDLLNPKRQQTEFITALNDWRPVHQKVRGSSATNDRASSTTRPQGRRKPSNNRKSDSSKKKPRRGKDETREGWTYNVLKWPLLVIVLGWIFFLGASYLATRLYIYLYEQYVTWRGTRERLRQKLREQNSYEDWVKCADELDRWLGNDKWKAVDEYAYYDCRTVRRVKEQMAKFRRQAELEEGGNMVGSDMGDKTGRDKSPRAIDELRALVEACVKNNFAGFENPRLYSETYFGTKTLVQDYVDEVSKSLDFILHSDQLAAEDRRQLSKHLSTNFGRTALCLSGGATFAYYHFGIAKALLDADLLPQVITGTSGGALVAALLATRTNEELKALLIPALAYRITACEDPPLTWARRWWRTGARFDSVSWAKKCGWFCHGSLTFLEAYHRTGRILNVSCVPSDPHSPTILANYLTAPDCVIWSTVLASAAVPGILNPIVLMRKTKAGTLEPYSFGHKWKDGSLRTDIPLKALNLHFNVNFSIVSQVNPHINLFFFSSRGSVGRPVTHRRGRGWRGGFLGSATEQYLKLDMTKWLKVLRHLELLPRPLGQDWSELWLQRFSGTITIWPRSRVSDFWHILSDPSMQRLGHMIRIGQLAAWPKLQFVSNRMKIERVVEEARKASRPPELVVGLPTPAAGEIKNVFSTEDLKTLLKKANGGGDSGGEAAVSPGLGSRFEGWLDGGRVKRPSARSSGLQIGDAGVHRRGSSVIAELRRQSGVFFDDKDEAEGDEETGEDTDIEGSNAEDSVDDDDVHLVNRKARNIASEISSAGNRTTGSE